MRGVRGVGGLGDMCMCLGRGWRCEDKSIGCGGSGGGELVDWEGGVMLWMRVCESGFFMQTADPSICILC